LNILFSYPDPIQNEIELINEVLSKDIFDFFHLRKPDYEINAYKKIITQIDESLHHKIMIHSHYSLIAEFDLAGINLNKKALSQMENIEEIDQCYIQPLVCNNGCVEVNRTKPNSISYSAHSIQEIKRLPFQTDYVFLSPIFNSISKQNYKSNFELDTLKTELLNINTKVIALGGVMHSHKSVLEHVGFKGMAVLGEFWLNQNQPSL
jgi:thiamine-phosphate pyrophosphorylase